MTYEAAAAREAAMHFEAKKTGFGQAQDGWSLTLRIQDTDIPPSVRDAKKGTRYMVVLVELNDDESPRIPAPSSSVDGGNPAGTDTDDGVGQPGKREWSEMPYPQRAGIRCDEPEFQAFLADRFPGLFDQCARDKQSLSELSAVMVRHLCGVISRSFIKPGTEAARSFDDLDKQYRAYKNLPPIEAYEAAQ